MESVVLVIHLLLALAIIGLVLLQRSEGGGLGIGGGGGMGGLTTAKGAANALTRATAICAAAFFCTSLLLGILAGQNSKTRMGILDVLQQDSANPGAIVEQAPVEGAGGTETPSEEAEPPSAPVAE